MALNNFFCFHFRKDALARNMLKMYKVLPNEFDFVPKTWIMPSDYSQLLSYSIDMNFASKKMMNLQNSPTTQNRNNIF